MYDSIMRSPYPNTQAHHNLAFKFQLESAPCKPSGGNASKEGK